MSPEDNYTEAWIAGIREDISHASWFLRIKQDPLLVRFVSNASGTLEELALLLGADPGVKMGEWREAFHETLWAE